MSTRTIIVRFAVAATLFSSSLAAHGAEPEKVTLTLPAEHIKLYALVYSAQPEVVATVRLNDVPLARFDGKGSSGTNRDVQTWLVAGSNRLEVVFTKLPTDNPQPLLELALHGLPQPAMPDETNALVRLRIKKDRAKVGATLGYTFDLPASQAPPNAIWKVAAVNTVLTDADIKQIDALAADVLRAMQRGDAASLKRLMAFMLDVRAGAMGMDKKEMSDMIEAALPEMKKGLAKAKLASSLDHQLWAGGRVVAVTTKDGKPPISATSTDGGGAAVDIHVAKIDGHWTLCP